MWLLACVAAPPDEKTQDDELTRVPGDTIDDETDADADADADTDTDADADTDTDTDPGTVPADRLWTLGAADAAWTAHPLDADGSPHAPTEPIEAAFGMSGTGKVWVLTRYTYHVLVADSLAWIASGDRDDLFPAVSGEDVTVAMSVPPDWGDDGLGDVYLLVGEVAYLYTYDPNANTFAYATESRLGDEWYDPGAPDTDTLVEGWLSTDDAAGWAHPGSPRDTCGADADALSVYMAFLTDDPAVYLYDAGLCFDFVSTTPAASFSVFTLPGAPDPTAVTAIDWTGSALVAFTE